MRWGLARLLMIQVSIDSSKDDEDLKGGNEKKDEPRRLETGASVRGISCNYLRDNVQVQERHS